MFHSEEFSMTRGDVGGVDDKSTSSHDVQAKLWGFAVNSADLKDVHKRWLSDYVLPILKDGGSVSLVGEASRTGSSQHNLALSKRRASNIAAYLYFVSGTHFAVNIAHGGRTDLGFGEAAAAWAGHADGTEDAYFRAVRVRAWKKPAPPPPPPPDKRVVTTKNVVTKRRWKWVSTKSVGPSDIPGAVAGESLFKFYQSLEKQTKTGYGNFERSLVNSGFSVNRISYERVEDYSQRLLVAKMDVITTTVTYSWGIPSESVIVEGRIIYKYQGDEQRYKSFGNKAVPRDVVWGKALHPEERVFSELGPEIYGVFSD